MYNAISFKFLGVKNVHFNLLLSLSLFVFHCTRMEFLRYWIFFLCFYISKDSNYGGMKLFISPNLSSNEKTRNHSFRTVSNLSKSTLLHTQLSSYVLHTGLSSYLLHLFTHPEHKKKSIPCVRIVVIVKTQSSIFSSIVLISKENKFLALVLYNYHKLKILFCL